MPIKATIDRGRQPPPSSPSSPARPTAVAVAETADLPMRPLRRATEIPSSPPRADLPRSPRPARTFSPLASPAMSRTASFASIEGVDNVFEFLHSPAEAHRQRRRSVFREAFQNARDFEAFFAAHLAQADPAAPVSRLFDQPAGWTTETFHALFAAAWLHHPTEKGSYAIDLDPARFPPEQVQTIKKACQEQGRFRPSSHYNGRGYSMARGFAMLNGYDELLVQRVRIRGAGEERAMLFLKAEGAPLTPDDLRQSASHIAGYLHKSLYSTGRRRSQSLYELAETAPWVTPRAAENFERPYEKLLSLLGLKSHDPMGLRGKNKFILARDMARALFDRVGHRHGIDWQRAGNGQIGDALGACLDALEANPPPGGPLAEGTLKLKPAMVEALRRLAECLRSDGPARYSRVYRETIVTPEDLDRVVRTLAAVPSPT